MNHGHLFADIIPEHYVKCTATIYFFFVHSLSFTIFKTGSMLIAKCGFFLRFICQYTVYSIHKRACTRKIPRFALIVDLPNLYLLYRFLVGISIRVCIQFHSSHLIMYWKKLQIVKQRTSAQNKPNGNVLM